VPQTRLLPDLLEYPSARRAAFMKPSLRERRRPNACVTAQTASGDGGVALSVELPGQNIRSFSFPQIL
ncbi:hypothetical protein, partial [Burkholderia gladioli]|uniref:hypothetical protein n=1 Tax=Burkholderia gladioli TaxID=28095 RepID=UPI001C6165E3